MILSLEEKNLLLERLPEFELSYDSISHRKVQANVFVIIPKGRKALLWFTYWRGQNICFTLTLNERSNICSVDVYPVCFSEELSLSTLIYGTVFEVNGIKHFTCENIYYYKGKFTGNYNFNRKFLILGELFTYFIKPVAYSNNFLVVGIPVLKTDFQEAMNRSSDLPYQVYAIQMLNRKNNISEGIYLVKSNSSSGSGSTSSSSRNNNGTLTEAYFNVKATLQNDIYHLYCYGSDKPYSVAMIPSYKSSIMMNSLFRTIKENTNLDLLEESDDEEEFENSCESKFVDLNKSFTMKCVFLKRFRKWQPIEVFKGKGKEKEKEKEKVKLITYKEAQLLEK